MWKIDWTRYVDGQLAWAQALEEKADQIPGYESEQLRQISAEILNDVHKLIHSDTENRIKRLERRRSSHSPA